MQHKVWFFSLLLCASTFLQAQQLTVDEFSNPPDKYKPRPFWELSGTLNKTATEEQLTNAKFSSDYSGVVWLPILSTKPAYLSEDYFSRLHEMLDKADQLGMKVTLYDECDFPTGTAGGLFKAKYPNDVAKVLNKTATDITGPANFTKTIPAGSLMCVVAMNNATKERIDISTKVSGGSVTWSVPVGSWKIMIFTCVNGWSGVDYLEPNSVNKFISLTHQNYYDRFPDHFGKTIDLTFFDDLAFYYVEHSRMWTPLFNTKYKAKYGVDPAILYPALWYDIGDETTSARNALFGFRAELMAGGYPKLTSDWCRAHKILGSGHQMEPSALAATGRCGDYMKFFKYLDIPTQDEIFYFGHARKTYKMTSSAAYNYDKPRVLCETFGAMPENMGVNTLYKQAMELFAKGITELIIHAMWYDINDVKISPELSYRSAQYGPELPLFNTYVGRLSRMLSGGRHVADIAMLYPIASLNASYYLDASTNSNDYTLGEIKPQEADYMDVSEMLSLGCRRDFTYLHPEILDSVCTVANDQINLNNKVNFEKYKVFVMPGMRAIHWSNLQKIKQFYDNGGKVISTTRLPSQSAEPGHDADVQATIKSMFGIDPLKDSTQIEHIKIVINGQNIKTYIDSVLVDDMNDASLTAGKVGFREADGESGIFDNMKVTLSDNTVLFEDDFSNGLAKWVNTANAAINNGQVLVSNNELMRSNIGSNWTNYTVEADLSVKNTAAGIVFRSVDVNNYYMWQIKGNMLYPHKKVNGGFTVLKNVSLDKVHGPSYKTTSNANGGKCYFAASPSVPTMTAMLDDAMKVYDVEFENNTLTLNNGNLSYIHKVIDGTDRYFIANSSDNAVNSWIRIRGKITPQLWDPRTGTISEVEYNYTTEDGYDITRVHIILAASTSIFVINSSVVPSIGGLNAEYFSDTTFTKKVLTRVDPTVCFYWKNSSPDTKTMPVNNFSVRWSGFVQPLYDETYTFYTVSDDGVRLWVNDKLLIDNWSKRTNPIENKDTITLKSGQFYNIKLDYFEATGRSSSKLEWSSPSQERQVIPQSRLSVDKLPNNILIKKKRNEITLYPNPAKDLLTVISESSTAGETAKDIQITDLQGRLVFTSEYRSSLSINTSKLQSGIYFVKIDNDVQKFVKQ